MKIAQSNNEIMTTLSVNEDELVAIINALNETLGLIEDWEYQTRMGVSKEEVTAMLDQFRELK